MIHRQPALLRPLPTALRTTLLAMLLAGGLLLLAACGKEGMPQPRDTAKAFTWKSVTAKESGNCIIFTGLFEGAHENLDQIRLELASVNGPEDCPECPFVPKEIVFFSKQEAGYNDSLGEIRFSYCPKKAPAYRWRLSGVSIFNSIPHSISSVRVIVMDQ